jgi:pyridoxal/pyridoxine/pyridoxamine kinase
MSGLSVNGAGDIFAAVFIREFITHNLKNAILTSCEITTSLLKEKTKNEKV